MFYRKKKETNNNIEFHSLAPTGNAEKAEVYFSALDWAIKEKNIKNIAMTGNYGSGKSSILNTYYKKNKNKKRFLNISLASFDKKDYEKDENVIEKSILQQLFYKEKITKTPFSRFKKINNLNDKLWLKILIMILIIFSVIWFINPSLFYSSKDWIIDKFKYNFIFFNTQVDIILNFLIKSIIGILSFSIIVFLLQWIYKTVINISYKFTIKKHDMELEITQKDKQNNESIFNKYIDEIIYFFEVTDYDIIIFEDLDRIKNYSTLFVKLRELNTLLNNSKIIKKDKITFVYAVKDDVFSNDKERTKFFEFIIPVIPIINSNNSKDKLLDLIKDTPFMNELSDSKFLSNITLYIDDMRLLNSIINEFNIYSQQIDINFDAKKLFSLITYKNLFPEDFSNLQSNSGILYQILNEKEENLKSILLEMESQHTLLKSKIEELKQNYKVNTIDDLKRIIWSYIIQTYSGYSSFYINGTRYESVTQFINDKSINTTEALKDISFGFNSYSNQKISNVINNIDEKIQYTKDELDAIITQKTKQISSLDEDIIRIKSQKISDIIKKYGIKKYFDLPEDMGILAYLLKNGFIDESYRDYINYFYPTTLSIEDKNFILNFNNQTKTEYNYILHNICNVIDYFDMDDYLREEILNFDLLEYMLKNAKSYNTQLNNIFQQLNNNAYGLEFLKEYIINRKITQPFIVYFAKHCSTVLNQLMESLTDTYKRKFLHRVLIYADIKDIKEYLSSNQTFIMQVNECKYFCRLFNNDTLERATNILQMLNIKFVNIDKKTINSELFDFIYKGNYYEINLKNIELILTEKLKVNIDNVKTRNYSTILDYTELSNYINDNIQKYITEVFLKYKDNTIEDIKCINKLLNLEDLDVNLKREIIKKEQTIIDLNDITEIVLTENDEKETSLWELYFEENKVLPSFANIILYYNKYSLNSTLISFINNNSNNLEKDIALDTESYETFITDIIKNDQINDKCFSHIVSLVPIKCTFDEFDFSNINKIRSKQILTNSKIEIIFNKQNYNSLRENYNELLITFIENNIKEFCSFMNELEYDINLIVSIIESTNIDRSYKIIIINNCNEDIAFTNISQKEQIVDFILKGRKPLDINYNLFKVLVDSKLDSSKSIALIIFQESKLDNDKLSNCLLQCEIPYCDIAKNNKVPKLVINDQNTRLKELLEKRKFDYLGKITVTKDGKYYKINKKQNR